MSNKLAKGFRSGRDPTAGNRMPWQAVRPSISGMRIPILGTLPPERKTLAVEFHPLDTRDRLAVLPNVL